VIHMKVYLTWRADPPDPPYWDWIEELPGIVVSLSGMKLPTKDSLSYRNIKKKLGVRFTVIIDSLTTPLWKSKGLDILTPQSLVLYMQHVMGADILVHKDYPLIDRNLAPEVRKKLWQKTITNAEAALKLAEKFGLNVMLVVQGWDLESYVRCAEIYRQLGAKHIGIGSLAPKKSKTEFVLEVAKNVRSVVGSSVHIHVFGVSLPRAILNLARYADSVDVSTPIRAAAAREIMLIDNNELKRFKYSLINVGELELDEKERKILLNVLSAKNAHELTWNLALFNAYELFKWIKQLNIL